MKREFFRNLPSEIVIDILSRLPVRTILSCKCVCKSWLNLLETSEFIKSQLSKSVPGLAIYGSRIHSKSWEIFEFDDGLDLERHELHYNFVTRFKFTFAGLVQGSVNGLLFMRSRSLYICNPVTREFIEFHCPKEFDNNYSQVVSYGFGVSKMTCQHKVVWISHGFIRHQRTRKLLEVNKSECQVYTLGTRSWKSIAPGDPFEYNRLSYGAFLDGNLYWLVYDLMGLPWISCFDLETELFSTYSAAPFPRHGDYRVGVFGLRDCLCLSDNTSDDDIVIWLMKEDGVEKSWTKEFVISKNLDFPRGTYEVVHPIKVFKDGDILMTWGDSLLFYYSKKNNTTQKIDMFDLDSDIKAIVYTPSVFSLKCFGMENVTSF